MKRRNVWICLGVVMSLLLSAMLPLANVRAAKGYKKAYRNVVKEFKANNTDSLGFGLAYIDEDDSPELICATVYDSGYLSNMHIYTFAGGKAFHVAEIFPGAKTAELGRYLPKQNNILEAAYDSTSGEFWVNLSRINQNHQIEAIQEPHTVPDQAALEREVAAYKKIKWDKSYKQIMKKLK